ncbi:MAG: FeoB-associated Cys-rich membrane protein [Ruminococcaceae bacterium]|nr:FeoB-associated Cys-rich membrane protein [Oscillospiraceae bacterium]
MENIIIFSILLAIVISIIWYLICAKKRGETCVGCPHAKQCATNANHTTKTNFTTKINCNCNCDSNRSHI